MIETIILVSVLNGAVISEVVITGEQARATCDARKARMAQLAPKATLQCLTPDERAALPTARALPLAPH